MTGQNIQETKVTLNVSERNVDACLEVETLFLCMRPDKMQVTLLRAGERRDKKICASFLVLNLCYHYLRAFMYIGIQVKGILKRNALLFHLCATVVL